MSMLEGEREVRPTSTMLNDSQQTTKFVEMLMNNISPRDPRIPFLPSLLANQIPTVPELIAAQLGFQLNHMGPWSTSPPSPSVPPAQISPSNMPLTAGRINNNNNNNNNFNGTEIDPIKVKRRKAKTATQRGVVKAEGGESPTSTRSSPTLPVSGGGGKDRQFVCGICKRSFGYKHVLQNHERTHTGEKPFECTQCNKRFTRDHHLKTHIRLHTGEKPYPCEHCPKRFVQVANLRRHTRVHSGEKPYTCDVCESRFSDSNQLKSHRQRCRSKNRHVKEVKEENSRSSDYSDDAEPRLGVLHHVKGLPVEPAPFSMEEEQTEPIDMSMSTGLNSHSSGGDSPRSRSSREDLGDESE